MFVVLVNDPEVVQAQIDQQALALAAKNAETPSLDVIRGHVADIEDRLSAVEDAL